MMINSYGTIGLLETISAYFAFFMVFTDYGFTFDGLVGSGIGFKKPYDKLEKE